MIKQSQLLRFAFGIILILILSTIQPRPIYADQDQTAASILQQVNQFRLNNGLAAFEYNGALASAAQNHANYMATNMIFSSHVGSGGSTPQSRAEAAGYIGFVSENIVGGTRMSAAQGLNWWRNSPVHYNTLVTSRYSHAGTGFATDGEINYYVLVVGRPSSAPPPLDQADDSPAPLFITPITLATPREDGSIVHVVQDGQALWTLAAYYEVPLTDILLYNGLQPDSFVQPGDEVVIRLADGQAPPPTPTPPLTHVVQDGQSLWSIAIQYDLSFADLLWYNALDENDILQPGTELTIRLAPGQSPPPTPTPVLVHTIQTGETLWDVALAYGLNLDELLALNAGLTADSIIVPGQQVQVRLAAPTAVSTQPPPTTPTPPTPVASPTPEPTPIATEITAVSEPLSTATPAPAALATNGRSTSQNSGLVLIGVAVLLAIGGGAFLVMARQEG